MEFAEVAAGLGETFAHQPHVADMVVDKEIHHLLVLLVAHVAQFSHVAEYCHLGFHRHVAEVLQCGAHACGVCVVCIHDEFVRRRHFELRTVVRRHIIAQSLAHQILAHAEVDSDAGGGEHIVYVVASYQMSLHLVPLALTGLPAELEVWRTLHHLAAYEQ